MQEQASGKADNPRSPALGLHGSLGDALRNLFPDGYGLSVERLAMHAEGLEALESLAVASANLKRRCEFAAGRAAARRALEEIGVHGAIIPAGADRAPMWPAGTVGSISHAKDLAVAVVALTSMCRAIGVDIEVEAAVTCELWPLVLVPRELQWIKSLAPTDQQHWSTIIFSAKEAFYKFQYPLTRCWLEFADVEIEVKGTELLIARVLKPPMAVLACDYHGRMLHRDGFVVTAFYL